MNVGVRDLLASDAADVAAIYNSSVAKRLATFDESSAAVAEVENDLRTDLATHPGVAVLDGDRLVAYAVAAAHSAYPPYRSIAEFSVYVAEDARGLGVGRRALDELVVRCKAAGFTKLIARVMATNAASRRLCAAAGFREVGVYERHAQLDGTWRDVVIVERLLGTAPG